MNMTGQQNNDNRRLETKVRQAIQSYEPLRALYCPVTVQVRDGQVRLEGTVRCFLGTVYLQGRVDFTARREAAAKVAAEVEGVSQVVNELVIEERTNM